MSDAGKTVKPRMSTGLRIVFGLSLALNLLVVTAVAGAWMRHGGPPGGTLAQAGLARLLYRELPRKEQRALRQSVRQSFDRDMVREVRVGPALDAALRADPFDAKAVRSLMDRQSQALRAGQETMRSGWLEVLDGMSREDRLAYADRVRDALRHARRPRGADKP